MAARKTTTRTLRIIRTVLLLLLAGFLVLVYALYRFGRAGLPDDRSATEQTEEDRSTGTAVMAGEGFDYSITRGDDTIARIRARRVLSEEEDEITLEGLDPVEIYRDDGDLYRVTSDTGVFNLHTQATRLSGSVVLNGPRGLEMRTEGLEMGPTRNTVISDADVSFRMAGEFVGRANRMTAYLDDDIFKLSEGVRLTSTSPDRESVTLTCNRLTFNRANGTVRAEGRVEFSQGASYVHSRRMVFHLTDDERGIRYINGRWGLRARFFSGFGSGMTRQHDVFADRFSAVLDPETNELVEAEMVAERSTDVRLQMIDETGLARHFAASVIHALFRDGELRHAEASGPVRMREFLEFSPSHILKWACARNAVVDFDAAGEIEHAVFIEKVEFRDGQSVGKGDRVELTGDPYVTEMVGQPARFFNAQGELTAPRIRQEGEANDVVATGGVRGQFEPAGGAESISIGGARGTIRVESSRARWNQQTPSFKFEENVRLWQDENLLLAEEVETLTDQDLVVARGGVRTLMEPDREEDEAPEEATADAASEDEAIQQGPVEITSEWMEYGLKTRRVAYHGDVVMQQAGRRMTCQDAVATLRDGGGMETMHCTGGARIVDNVAGRTVSGEDALYRVAASEITFNGNPVVMTGEEGERIEGATLVYDLNTGAARVERATGPVAPPVTEPTPDPADTDHGPDSEDNGANGGG